MYLFVFRVGFGHSSYFIFIYEGEAGHLLLASILPASSELTLFKKKVFNLFVSVLVNSVVF